MIFFVGLAWRTAHIFTRKDFNAIFSNPPCRSASPLKISPGGIFWVANNERHSSVLSRSFKSFLDFLFMFTGVCEDPMHSSSRYYAAQRGITSVHTMCICIHVSAFVFLYLCICICICSCVCTSLHVYRQCIIALHKTPTYVHTSGR